MLNFLKRKRYQYAFHCRAGGKNFTVYLNLNRKIISRSDLLEVTRFISIDRALESVEILDYMYVCRV